MNFNAGLLSFVHTIICDPISYYWTHKKFLMFSKEIYMDSFSRNPFQRSLSKSDYFITINWHTPNCCFLTQIVPRPIFLSLYLSLPLLIPLSLWFPLPFSQTSYHSITHSSLATNLAFTNLSPFSGAAENEQIPGKLFKNLLPSCYSGF